MSMLSEKVPQGMQDAIQPEENAPGRAAEAVMLVIALALGLGGLAMVGYSINDRLPDAFWTNALVLAALSLTAHIVLRIRAPYADQVILPAVMLLNTMSLAMITRLEMDDMNGADAGRHLMWTSLGIVVACVLILVLRDHRVLRKYTYTVMVLALVLVVLPLIPGLGQEINGARIWIYFAGFSLQPAEFAKILFAIFFAGYLVANRDTLALAGKKVLGLQLPRMRDLGPILVVWAVSLTVLVGQKDLGTSLLFFGLFVGMLYLATERGGWVAIGLSMFVVGAFAAWTIFGHVQRRVTIWLDPLDPELIDAVGGSFQVVQGMFGMAYGGMFGAGWGEGYSSRIPFAFSDMIYAAFGEELGLTGLLAILLVYLVIVQRGLRTAIGVRDGFGKLLAGGLAFVMALQLFVVVGGITRVIPLTGLTLPFMAQGGSSLIANWIVIALLLRTSDAARRPSALPTRGQLAGPAPTPVGHPGTDGAIEVGPGASRQDREAARQSMPSPSDEMTQMQAPIRYDGGDQA
ncbi:FtsW/RodA/SpoVE family cell cycle protein [Myceligenerans pegani]|uniref:FtsW/RodA/SpoVE family cell cycle protein n=1 Tax=Myceligenerans pegani TaxID=2776917 RepID=A0ABR9N3F1_9MICO|nr:FtsW/RodA/SpoVE family cell cycle protein [Myceligenerans sp. TRM 65318]MBE1877870.1 FtsW/RodA/SpoVE family cell cycle protein [Myceligenerans sp. TRM 65318]MBE3020141.1 FtsW/RodA/SpoVE family cell cycle protein [Myceligenerans sp. TRM 65318]